MTIVDSNPALLAAVYLCGRRQGRQDLRPVLDDARRETDDARRDALLDALTGLRNRRAAEHHLQAAALGGAHLRVGLVDARDLKTLNDTHGHSTGDRMLQAVATALTAVAAQFPDAMAFRYGGDEFLLTTHDTADPGLPERIAGLIHAHLAGYGAAHPHEHQPQVSIGWASTRHDVPAGGVVEAAGIALAAAKKTSRPRDDSTVLSIRYQGDPATARVRADVRIPAQRGPDTVSPVSVGPVEDTVRGHRV